MKNKEGFEAEIKEINEQIKTFKNMSWIFIWVGVLAFIIGIFYWLVDKNNFNEVGDFIGGVAGSLWALAGLFFIYIAFLGQKVEIKYQQEDLTLTREELKETKEVFKQQTQVMINQQLDNTFFNLLDNHRKVIDSFKKGNKNYHNRNNGFFGYGGYGGNDFNIEVISGYEVLESIYLELKKFLFDYSEYLKTNNIYDYRLTNTNPKEYIQSFPEIKMLYDEVLNILVFIGHRFNEEDQEFYFRTLSGNLNTEEKFLIEAYNLNSIKNLSTLIAFNVYEHNQFKNFNISKYITPKYIDLRGDYDGIPGLNASNDRDDIRLILDNQKIYSLIELYFVNANNKKLKLIKPIKEEELEKEIHLSKILLESVDEIFDTNFISEIIKRKERKSFKILVKSTIRETNTNIFYMFGLAAFFKADVVRYNFYSEQREENINDWIKDYFTQSL